MTYIILAAGKGRNLLPLTLKYPKTSYKLDEDTTVLQRLVRSIRLFDNRSEIVVVAGYLVDSVRQELDGENVTFIYNPFYEVTNSISTLWFARDFLERENVTIIHGDVVFDDGITQEYIVKKCERPYILIDSFYIKPGAYNVMRRDDQILVMSKKLDNFDAKYCCVTKLDAVSARLLKKEVTDMVYSNMYDQYYEDALVQMIMFRNFQLGCVDIAGRKWREVDVVDDLLNAQIIHRNSVVSQHGAAPIK